MFVGMVHYMVSVSSIKRMHEVFWGELPLTDSYRMRRTLLGRRGTLEAKKKRAWKRENPGYAQERAHRWRLL